ncbi:MAG: DUF4430 domain-containing protein [Oscillospiraceae bacterium]|jgi:hypothetical protein|nr:DUF4430 domain-containing protein [Oscillospiraceae bacterium]
MRKHKWKIIAPALIVAALAFTFWYGGGAPGLRGWSVGRPAPDAESAVSAARPEDGVSSPADADGYVSENVSPSDGEPSQSAFSGTGAGANAPSLESDGASAPDAGDSGTVSSAAPPGSESGRPMTADEKQALAAALAAEQSAAPSPVGDADYSAEQGMQIDPGTGKDRYMTDPVPEGRPAPMEPQDAVISDTSLTCTLSVRCDAILDNIDWLDPEKVELVPPDGVIFPVTPVTFYEGESVFDVLRREMRRAGIHMEFMDTPMYNSAYIEGINNLYEFDCGELSGWMYKVNDWFPNYGCSRYRLKDGDVVEWVYTCSLGVDVGGYYAVGG